MSKPAAPRDESYWSKVAGIEAWSFGCARGFVRNERFSRGTDQVIPGTNRTKTRETYRGGGASAAFERAGGARTA